VTDAAELLELPAALDRRSDLPGLLARAGQRLLDARNSAEVLEAKKIAEAALHYAKVTQAANETHADCLRIITRAEMRMANEIDRGQAAGELQRAGGARNFIVQPSDNEAASLDDLGIDRRRVSEWREVRDAGPEVVEQAIGEALDEGRAPTKADIHKHVRGTFGTGQNEWYTPDDHLARARSVLGAFDLDPASSDAAQQKVRAAEYFTVDRDGLQQEWRGRVWLNPPYAQPHIADFVSKMVAERRAGRVSAAIMLTHNYTDTTWFHEAAGVADAICFTRGRVRFYDASGVIAAPTQGQAFFYFGDDVAAFASAFAEVGFIVTPMTGEVA
jgi:phage N-6-adenine-methyltransferase